MTLLFQKHLCMMKRPSVPAFWDSQDIFIHTQLFPKRPESSLTTSSHLFRFSIWQIEPLVPAPGSPWRRGFVHHPTKTDRVYRNSTFPLLLRGFCSHNISTHLHNHAFSFRLYVTNRPPLLASSRRIELLVPTQLQDRCDRGQAAPSTTKWSYPECP